MTQTEVGRRLEKQQIALHALNRDVQKAGGLSPDVLYRHIIANEQDETLPVDAVALTLGARL